ncbi:iron-siderophore ABC transporter substrate-binding protein [Streptomonospora sp. S1-112]|uniref:Iron-siderophore ABC transporter substrate-binding protein n=1 Tax=Streptomonospora mangrovi TaxID=2883123 RepID=A0A9X3NJZ2_9ACTN|nr:iron-siderophore ABC transporter substrate-binding protein [Streptomonospora mangrovi]MDA0563461.1 iron-siderophore ABC transporter substrate-binding protein [Streptomonospora mangrovi]
MRSPLRAPALTTRLALTAAVALTAAGCGAPADTEDGASGGDWTPVTIEHAYGSTEITEKPERIVTVGWSDEATLLELGIVPVGMTASTYAGDKDGYLPWDLEKLEELDAEKPELINTDDGISAEQVANLAPDLILGVQSGMEESEYEQLSEVAATVPYLDQPWMTDWQDQTLAIGRAVGMEEEAQQLAEETAARVEDAAAEHPEFAEATFAVGSVVPDSNEFGFYVEQDARSVLMEQLGFTSAGFLEDINVRDGQFYGTLSMEKAEDIDADVLVMWYNTPEERERLEDNPVFQQIDAVRENRYVAYDDPATAMAISTPNPLTLPWVLEDYTADLAAAVEGEAP